jgi:deoxyribonuclease IV
MTNETHESNQLNTHPRIGAHVSAAGGIHKAIERSAAIGGNCVQVFTASPRSWRRPDIEKVASAEVIENEIKKAQKEYNIFPVVTHAMYLVNLASPKKEQLEKSRQVLEFDLEFDARVGGSGVVVHLGSHLGAGWEATREGVVEQIQKILSASSGESTLLIENSAGQNGKLCSDLSEIRWVLDQINSPRLGWCVDTCHAYAAGYGVGETQPIFTEERTAAAKPENIRNQTLLTAITENNLWDELKVVHINGSRDPFASGRDRHANIGEGELLSSDMAYFLNHEKVISKPMILEVPGLEGNGPDSHNVELVKAFFK